MYERTADYLLVQLGVDLWRWSELSAAAAEDATHGTAGVHVVLQVTLFAAAMTIGTRVSLAQQLPARSYTQRECLKIKNCNKTSVKSTSTL